MGKSRFTVLLGLMAPALAGCGGGGDGASLPQSVSAATTSGLTATLAEDRTSVTVGSAVVYTLRLANNTGQPITYQTQLGCGIDAGREGASLRVTDAAGRAIFPSPDGSGCGAVAVGPPVTLAPGQSVSDAVTPGVTLSAAGRYSATAGFAVESASESAFQFTTVGPIQVDAR